MPSFDDFAQKYPDRIEQGGLSTGQAAQQTSQQSTQQAAQHTVQQSAQQSAQQTVQQSAQHAAQQGVDQVVIWTDGSSRGNPGPGGFGAVLLYVDSSGAEHQKEISKGFSRTTNNRMELLAVITALEALQRPCVVEVHSDSQYVCNAFNQHWISGWLKRGWKNAQKQAVKNADLWKRLLRAIEPHQVRFIWVKGHAGTELNERCDTLATQAADGVLGPLAIDEGFEEA